MPWLAGHAARLSACEVFNRFQAASTLQTPSLSGLAPCLRRSTPRRHVPWQLKRTNCPTRFHSLVVAARGKDNLLKGIDPDHREDLARILDLAEQAETTWTTVVTDFYAPPVISAATIVLKKLAGVTAVPLGGYPQAERCRLCLGNAEALIGAAADPAELGGVSALEISGNFMFDPISHRDVLGACCTGTGVVRGKIGDILVHGEQGAQMLVVPDLVPHFEMFLTQIRSVPVTTRAIDLSELKVREPKVQDLRSVEASMRLDSVASAGFRVSRSQMSDLCSKGDVRVNWKPMKGSRDVQEGDVISCAGKGRLEIRSVSMTKKGKYAVEMVRLL